MPDQRAWYRLCDPCWGLQEDGSIGLPRHDACTGGTDTDFCECLAEVFIEAEEAP